MGKQNEVLEEKPEVMDMGKVLPPGLGEIEEGKIIKGRIVKIDSEVVAVDIGYKSEGIIPLSEFKERGQEVPFKEGEEIEVFLKRKEGHGGSPILSFQQAQEMKGFERLKNAYDQRLAVEARVVKKVKGGLLVDVGQDAFMPFSQVGFQFAKNPEGLVGQTVKVKLKEFNQGENLVVSQRSYLEEETKRKKQEILKDIKEGEVRKGVVRTITDFGAFIDLGGIDGLLHIGDISWGYLKKVDDALKVGEELEVKVLSFDPAKEKISLGLKQLTTHPWDKIEEKYFLDSVVSGKVTGLTDFGAFVELEKGVEGLIHISEMSWTEYVKHPSKMLKVGDIIQARVLKIDKDNKRISLGLKQAAPNPWKEAKKSYKPGMKVSGTVTSLAPFGAFVKLSEGIEGLLHISNFSWTERIKHPEDKLKVGDNIEVMILEVNPEEERISLGLKQIVSNPYKVYLKGKVVEGVVKKLTEFGAFVELDAGLEGFLHVSQISNKRIDSPAEVLKVGEPVTAKVIKSDVDEKVIEISIKEYEKDIEKKVIKKYINQKIDQPTLGELMREKFKMDEEEDAT